MYVSNKSQQSQYYSCVYEICDLELMSVFVQLANIMGRYEWLTCPRKVNSMIQSYSIFLTKVVVSNFVETHLYSSLVIICTGFVNWLASL